MNVRISQFVNLVRLQRANPAAISRGRSWGHRIINFACRTTIMENSLASTQKSISILEARLLRCENVSVGSRSNTGKDYANPASVKNGVKPIGMAQSDIIKGSERHPQQLTKMPFYKLFIIKYLQGPILAFCQNPMIGSHRVHLVRNRAYRRFL